MGDSNPCSQPRAAGRIHTALRSIPGAHTEATPRSGAGLLRPACAPERLLGSCLYKSCSVICPTLIYRRSCSLLAEVWGWGAGSSFLFSTVPCISAPAADPEAQQDKSPVVTSPSKWCQEADTLRHAAPWALNLVSWGALRNASNSTRLPVLSS